MSKLVCALAVVFLMGCDDHDHEPPDGDVSGILALTGDAQAGGSTFTATCGNAGCHGADGASGPAPDLTSYLSGHTEQNLAASVRYGIGSMPAQSALSDQQVADVIAYIKQLAAN